MHCKDRIPSDSDSDSSSTPTLILESLRKEACTEKNSAIEQQRKVRFNTKSVVVVLRDVSQEDLEECWYQSSDHSSFKLDITETISAFYRDIESLDTSKYCLLGLETQLTERLIMKRKRRAMECRRAVFSLQLHQHVSGISDPEGLREASHALSQKSSTEAFLRATVKHPLTA
jgi:hypothetical protein